MSNSVSRNAKLRRRGTPWKKPRRISLKSERTRHKGTRTTFCFLCADPKGTKGHVNPPLVAHMRQQHGAAA